MPLISIVVPVYNVARWLPICMKSIFNQTFTDFEVILVDDGSSDKSGILCDQYVAEDSRVKVIHQTNGGLSTARNVGTAIAKGDYVTYIDSDDYVEPYYLKMLYQAIETTGAELAVARFDKVRPRDSIVLKQAIYNGKIVCWDSQQATSEMALGKNNSIISCCKLGKRELYIKYPFETGKYHEDIRNTYLLIHDCKKIASVDVVVYHYVMHEGSITTKKLVSEKQIIDFYEAMESYRSAVQKWYPDVQTDIDASTAKEYMSIYLMSKRVMQPSNIVIDIRKSIVQWFKISGWNAVTNRKARLSVRLRALLMCISPELYRFVYYLGIKFTGKRLG